MTRDWSSDVSVPSDRRSLWLMTGRGFSSPEPREGPEKTSAASLGPALAMRDVSLGNGGTGGGKASNRGELGYVAIEAEDGEEVRVRCNFGDRTYYRHGKKVQRHSQIVRVWWRFPTSYPETRMSLRGRRTLRAGESPSSSAAN